MFGNKCKVFSLLIILTIFHTNLNFLSSTLNVPILYIFQCHYIFAPYKTHWKIIKLEFDPPDLYNLNSKQQYQLHCLNWLHFSSF